MLSRILKISHKCSPLVNNSFRSTQLKVASVHASPYKYFYSQAQEKVADAQNVSENEKDLDEENTVEVLDEQDMKMYGERSKPSSKGADQEAVAIEQCQIVEVAGKTLLRSSYGTFELKGSLLPPKKVQEIKTLYYVNDSVSINYIRKVLKSDLNGLVIFDPNAHFTNMNALYSGYKRKLYEHFYGTNKKPRNPFKNCKTNKDIFNLSRRVKMQTKSFLNRICTIVDYNGTLRVKGDNVPYSDTLKGLLLDKSKDQENKVGFYKHHYLVCLGYLQGVHSSDEWEKVGIKVEALSDKKVYPLYSVWSPTSQNYLSLYRNYLEEKRTMVKSRKNIIELGCGTGILSFMTVQHAGAKDCYAVDFNKRAVDCTSMNAQILDMTDSIKAKYLDVVDAVKNKRTEQALKDIKFPTKYEMIISNPPWITASILNTEHELDNAIYDPNESFLQAIFEFAAKHLSVQSPLSKNGTLLLYYSDLSKILGLQPAERIEELCKQHNLIILNKTVTKFIDDYSLGGSERDPLVNFKNEAKVMLYEITRS